MEFESKLNLYGNEFLTTYFIDDTVMILALGENTNFEKNRGATIYLYLCADGDVDYCINTFVFFEPGELDDFLEKLPEMNAFDFIMRGTGIQPTLYE
ncbi:hypothetical protein [Sporosarcina sp. FSL K6-2383]|uniref:hypothetical protein n=1 Tax=Sporosarcina sp. FSL K6-2383 TaxID=2921556 RepID=UPI00315AB816